MISAEENRRLSSTQVCIVGGGPIGLELAVALRKRGVEFEIIEAGPIGQTMTWWAPQTRWFSSNERIAIAGVPLVTPDQSKATREQYLAYLRSVALQFDINVRTFEKVTAIDANAGGGFSVTSKPAQDNANRVTRCDQVVLAIGGTDFPKPLSIPGEELSHVDGYLREPHHYFGRRVLVVGGRNSAVEAALRLHHAGADVSLSYRGEDLPHESIKYWLSPEINGLIRAGRIKAHFSTVPIEITGESVSLQNLNGDSNVEVPADDVLLLIGYEQDKTLMEQAGLELIESTRRPAFDEATMQTSVPGIYVAGTAVAGTQNSKYRTFLENCHVHVDRIVDHLTGQSVSNSTPVYESQIASSPES